MDAAQQRFTSLYDTRYRDILAYFMRRLDSTPAAQDLTEDVFVIAWRKLDQVPEEPEAAYWLYGVARRTLANYRRTMERRHRLTPTLRPAAQSRLEDPTDQLVRNDEARAVHDAISTLRTSDQELIRLAYWDELPHKVIGDLVGCSRSAVDVRLHRAVRRLRKALAHSGHFPIAELPLGTPKEASW